MTTLRTVIDPAELRWIWLGHTDFDHIGSLSTERFVGPDQAGLEQLLAQMTAGDAAPWVERLCGRPPPPAVLVA